MVLIQRRIGLLFAFFLVLLVLAGLRALWVVAAPLPKHNAAVSNLSGQKV